MKRRFFAAVCMLGMMAILLICSADTSQAVRDALALCVRSVVPALFPFFVLSSLFVNLGCADVLGQVLAPFTGRLFGISGAGGTAFLLGIVGGYPVGARTVSELYRNSACDREECERLLSFCNNAGPSFILGIAGLGCFGSLKVGTWLYLIHVTAAIMVGLLFRTRSHTACNEIPRSPAHSWVQAFIDAVRGGTASMLYICGFIVFFLVLLQLLTRFTGIENGAILGIIEMTNGILRLKADRWGFICAAGLLGWGGVSIHCQTVAVIESSGLSMKHYFTGKALQAVFSIALAWPASRFLL